MNRVPGTWGQDGEGGHGRPSIGPESQQLLYIDEPEVR
jgi:hypothetical protein